MTKLGPHCIRATDAALRWASRAPIVKALDARSAFLQARPDAIRVFRHYFPQQNLDDATGTAAAIVAALGGYRHPLLYVETWNEVHPTVAQLHAVVTKLHAAGVKVAGGSWGTGDYTRFDFDLAGAAGCDALALHAYWGTWGFTSYHALRYRQFWQAGDPPILLTEVGRDAVEAGQAGWKKSGVDADVYRAELIAYDLEISHDTYVLGATVFSAGPTPDWDAFDTDSFSDKMPGGAPVPPSPTYSSPNHDGKRAQTLGVVLHSSRGGSASPQTEYDATVAWFDNPASQVSAHAVVGPGGKVHLSVDPDNIAWHCRARNAAWLGIELPQAHHGDPIGADILDAAAKIVAGWHQRYGFPLRLSLTSGLCQHFETAEGIADGKTDIDAPFSASDFLARVQRIVTPPPVLNVSELTTFPDWAKARLGNNQDFRQAAGLADFVAHLKGSGRDASNPGRYGWPG